MCVAGRSLRTVVCQAGGGALIHVGTSHLESPLGFQNLNVKTRKQQYQQVSLCGTITKGCPKLHLSSHVIDRLPVRAE